MKNRFLMTLIFLLSTGTAGAKVAGNSKASSSDSDLSEMSLGIERSLYMDIFLFSGYAEFSHPSMSEAVAGSHNGIGGSIGVKIGWGVFAGITADYRYMAQISTVDNNHLNLSSTRFAPFSPTLGFKYEGYLVKLDYQLSGALDVKKSLTDGSTLQLDKPEGFRLMFIFSKLMGLPVGVFYENVRFKEQSISDSGVTQLSRTFDTWQLGGLINVLF